MLDRMMNKELDAPTALNLLSPWMTSRTGRSYDGFRRTTPFRALIGTMLSLRARGAVVSRVAADLFDRVSAPQDILDMSPETLMGMIRPLGHKERRERLIRATCQILVDRHGGEVPEDEAELMALPGVGRKTTNLTLDAGFGHLTVTVDTHVHRIMNIWGYVGTKDADETEVILRSKLPRVWWRRFNSLLVDFGNLVCWPSSPKCSECPLGEFCPKNGVEHHR